MEESEISRPIFVLGPVSPAHPMMRQALLAAPGTWEADSIIEGLAEGLSPADVRTSLAEEFSARDHVVPGDAVARLVCCPAPRVPVALLASAFPGAFFLYLHCAPELLVAGSDRGPDETVDGWVESTSATLDALDQLPRADWSVADHADLMSEPDNSAQRIFAALGLGWHPTCSKPWRYPGPVWSEPAVDSMVGLPPHSVEQISEVVTRVQALVESPGPSLAPTTAPGSLTAVDDGLGEVLRALGSSLLVSTYQSNRIVVLRHGDGHLGVHLREFDRPMGIAMTPQGFALGVRSEVLDYRDFPAVAENIEPKGRHDACFMPRNSHVTGDVAIHDLGLGRDGLWVVATSFSCLATLDADHSFVPRWRPPFITALAPEDRCHLNGLALVDGIPRYVTALGTSDTAGGWRPHKAFGGVLMEVPSGNVVLDGLSMPHSPRWHDGRLYLLESGRGRLVVCNLEEGTTETVAELPGFTRGLSFHGGVAFVGTSQVRETATFGGLPIAALPHRECGVWAIELATGTVLGVVRFEDRIQEIFDVAVAVGRRFPEIAEQTSDLVRTSWYVPSPLAAEIK